MNKVPDMEISGGGTSGTSRVTAVLCCYSHPIYFEQAINSILNQSYKNLNIIIHNNGCDDSYSKLIDEYSRKYGLHVIVTRPNTYGQAFRYDVLPYIETEYLAKLHDDDVFFSNKLERSLQVLVETGADYLVTNSPYIDEFGEKWNGADEAVCPRPFTGQETRGELLADMLITPGRVMHYSTLVIRTSIAKRTMLGDPFWPRIADCLFWSQLHLDESIHGVILPEDLSKVRIHGANDRLYLKFDPKERARQQFLLSLSEIELIRRVLSQASEPVLLQFLERYARVKPGREAVEALVEAALSISPRLWGPQKMIAPMFFHAAYKRDALRAMALIQELANVDANRFMSSAYNELAKAMIPRAVPRPSKLRYYWRHPGRMVTHAYAFLSRKYFKYSTSKQSKLAPVEIYHVNETGGSPGSTKPMHHLRS